MDRGAVRNATLLGMFLASGCSALIYEIVWFQQLSLVLGASAISLAILLTSFMGGMCLGSLGFARWVPRRHHPLRMYAVMELVIAFFGLGTLAIFPIIGRLYSNLSLTGTNDVIARSVVAFLLLLPPTAMMGATLPAISRWVESTRTGMAWLGWFYGANTFGAMMGCLLAGMYLLRFHDVIIATYVAAAMNIGVAFAALALAHVQRMNVDHPKEEHVNIIASAKCGMVYVVIAISGLTALGGEVVWTRYLGLLLGPTVYTFAVILAVYLLGLAIGSGAGSIIGRRVSSPGLALAIAQLLLLFAIPYAAYMIVNVVPSWLALRGADERFTVRLTRDVVRTAVALLPATLLWGASFPFAAAAMVGHANDSGRFVGRLYAANTFGAIVGSLAVSLFAMPYGGQWIQQCLTGLSGLSGMLMLASILWPAWNLHMNGGHFRNRVRHSVLGIASLLIAAVGSFFAWRSVPIIPVGLLADGKCIYQWDNDSYYLYVGEGIDSPIVVSAFEDGTRCFHVAGKVEASTIERDVRTQRLLGHLPAMAHSSPKKVLVVGCGSGMTAGSFLLHPSVEQIVLCEMEKCVIEASRENFADFNYGVLSHPKTRIVHDDARHFLATTRESFDVITTDPIHPWVKGAATLYTSEFFQLCRSHLNPNGVVTLWVPLYESSEDTVKCEMATFLQVFPEASIWSGQTSLVGYDLVVVASGHGLPIDVDGIVGQLTSNESLQRSLDEVGLGTPGDLRKSFAAMGRELAPWLKGAQINRDCNLRLQYLAGKSSDSMLEQYILRAMTASQQASADRSIPMVDVISVERRQ